MAMWHTDPTFRFIRVITGGEPLYLIIGDFLDRSLPIAKVPCARLADDLKIEIGMRASFIANWD
jgi:hypothetical protein